MKIPISTKLYIRSIRNFTSELGSWISLRGWSTITLEQIQYGWWPPSWKSLWHRNSAADWPICTKFGVLMQNDIPMTIKASKSKSEIELQYGGRLFSETGSCNISAEDWDNSLKFGVQIDLNVLRWVTLPNLKPEVHLRRHSRHLETRYDVISPARLTDVYKIWYADAERHATADENIEIETGNIIPIWRPFVFRNQRW